MNICFVISNMEHIDDTWSTTHLAHEALKRGNSVAFVESTDFEVTAGGRLVARASYANEAWPERTAFATALSNRALQRRYMEVSQFDLMMVRVNPLNLSTLSFLLMAQETGVPVVNNPVGIVRTRSKAWLASLKDVPSPKTIVTHYTSAAVNFYEHLGQSVVVKPTQASGGRGVSLVRARRPEQFMSAFRSALAIAAGTTGRMASGQVVVQAYVSEAKDGEKRLVWVDGTILGAYLRKRKVGEFRHNLKQGAQPCSAEITPTDQRISDSLSPHLLRNGIRFAGLDVIGSLLIEVNTLNPGGIHFADCFRSPATPSIGGLAIEKLTGATPTPLYNPRPSPLSISKKHRSFDDRAGSTEPLTRKQVQDALRRRQSLEGMDMRGTDLSGLVFDDADLQSAKLADADLSGCSFVGANLMNASMWHANLHNANLDNCNLEGADLDFSNLEGCTVKDAKIRKAIFPLARIPMERLKKAVTTGHRLYMDSLRTPEKG